MQRRALRAVQSRLPMCLLAPPRHVRALVAVSCAVRLDACIRGSHSVNHPRPQFAPRYSTSGSGAPSGGPDEPPPTLKVSDLDLQLGDDLPPLLLYNAQLVDAGTALLDFANSETLPADVEHKLVAVIDMLFSDAFMPVADQFATVRQFAVLPEVRKRPAVVDACHSILVALIPRPLSEFLIVSDRDMPDLSNDQRVALEQFVFVILQGKEDDAEYLSCLQRIEAVLPGVFQVSSFVTVLQHMNHIMLQTRLSYLLVEACRSFDPQGTGKIKMADLKASLERVVPKAQAATMMAHVEADNDGNLFYPQLASVLLHGVTNGDQPQPQS